MSDNDIERRSRLLSVKLAALVRSLDGEAVETLSSEPCPLGASLLADDVAWLLIDGDASRSLGPSLAWVMRQFAPRVPQAINLVVENSSGLLVRRAAQFDLPISVWREDGQGLTPAVSEPHSVVSGLGDDAQVLIDQIEQAGAEAVIECGVIIGEVRGLEMCRVVQDDDSGQMRLEVGIGAHDREAFAMVHSERPTSESISSVVEAILAQRYVDAPLHPYNTLAAERFLRWRVVHTPELIGLSSLRPIDPPVRRENVKDAVPCVGRGIDVNGNDVLAVFVHGIDLDVVPFAVDVAGREEIDAVLIVSRPQDVTNSIRTMASAARSTIDFVALR